jgi:hypothetical protein
MNPQEKNWQNLFGDYNQDGTTWHALTTVYSLDLAVIRAYKFTRKFSTNADCSVIYHDNTYYLEGEQTRKQSWQLDKEKCNQGNGIFHPEAENMRAIGFDNNTSIWVAQTFREHHSFGSEIFFKQQDLRYGIIPVYQQGTLERIVLIKEHKAHFPDTLNPDTLTNLSGYWQVKQTFVTPDLQESITENTISGLEFNPSPGESNLYFLPEKILLQLPKTLALGQSFKIIVSQQMSDGLFVQITSDYDVDGQLEGLVSSEYERINSDDE